jgi:hypothetical protein
MNVADDNRPIHRVKPYRIDALNRKKRVRFVNFLARDAFSSSIGQTLMQRNTTRERLSSRVLDSYVFTYAAQRKANSGHLYLDFFGALLVEKLTISASG